MLLLGSAKRDTCDTQRKKMEDREHTIVSGWLLLAAALLNLSHAPYSDAVGYLDELHFSLLIVCLWMYWLLWEFEDKWVVLFSTRFAARKGMWGFVKAMTSYVQLFIKERRMICEPVGRFPLQAMLTLLAVNIHWCHFVFFSVFKAKWMILHFSIPS